MMKLWRFFKSTVKRVRKVASFSLFFLLLAACSKIPSTYQRYELASTIQKICAAEFDAKVKVWEVGDSIWVYAPFEQLLNEQGRLLEDANKTLSNIFLVLKRVVLSVDRPPQFYAIVISDVKHEGADIYYVGRVSDMVKLEMQFISLGELQEREVFIDRINQDALNDYAGHHIKPHDIKIGDFISYLIRQAMEQTFSNKAAQSLYKIEDLDCYFEKGRLSLTFEILELNNDAQIKPFQQAKSIIRKFLDIYADQIEKIVEIEITDVTSNISRLYSRRTFLEETNQ